MALDSQPTVDAIVQADRSNGKGRIDGTHRESAGVTAGYGSAVYGIDPTGF
jgi:hypothetical protein